MDMKTVFSVNKPIIGMLHLRGCGREETLHSEYSDRVYGVNSLGDLEESCALAHHYGARFVQVDSICGHLTPQMDAQRVGRFMDAVRAARKS